jgi:hypothetical protein
MSVKVQQDSATLPERYVVSLPESNAAFEVDTFGATILSWKPENHQEVLFVRYVGVGIMDCSKMSFSKRAKFDGQQAIHGGTWFNEPIQFTELTKGLPSFKRNPNCISAFLYFPLRRNPTSWICSYIPMDLARNQG